MLSQKEFGRRLGLKAKTIRQMELDGKLTAVRDSRGWRYYSEEELARVIEARKPKF